MPANLQHSMSMPPQPGGAREMPDFESYKSGSDNHFNPIMKTVDHNGNIITKRPLKKDDLAAIDDFEKGRGGTFMFKKGDQSHNWKKRYFVVKAQLLIYFALPTDETPLGVIPLEGCQIKIPDDDAPHFDAHSNVDVQDCFELWITHPHNRTYPLCAMSEMDRTNWKNSLTIRTNKQRMLQVYNSIKQGNSNSSVIPRVPPPGLQSSLSMPLDRPGSPVVSAKSPKSPKAPSTPKQIDSHAVKDVLNKSRRGSVQITEMAMMNTSSLRKRLGSALTPEEMKADEEEKRRLAKAAAVPDNADVSLMSAEAKLEFFDNKAVSKWQENRQGMIKKLAKEQMDHPMSLSFLLRGQLIALDRVMAEPPHPGSKVKVPHLKGDWAGEVVIAVYNTYSTDGKMSFEQFLSFMDDVDLNNTHLSSADKQQKKFEPCDVYREVLKGTDDCSTRAANFPEFYTILLVLCQRTYNDVFQRSSTDAMEMFLHEVIVPIYYFHMTPWEMEKCATTDPLVKDGRIALLLNAYLPNMWRVFLHYAQDLANRVPATFEETSNVNEFGTHKPLPAELAFPSMAQASERSLFAGVHSLPSLSPEAEAMMGQVNSGQVYTVHENGLQRFCEDFGLNEILPKKKILNIYKNVVLGRSELKNFAPPKAKTKAHPMANKMAPLGGRARSPIKSAGSKSLTGSPAFRPVGNSSASNRLREMEFRERSGSIVRNSQLETFNSIDEIMKARANAGPAVSSKISTSMYASKKGGHAPMPGELIQVPSGHAGFCEFVEIICTVATEGMCAEEHHHKMYPSAYDKVLALLCIWGVADCKRVEQAKFMWPWDKKVPQNKKKATQGFNASTK